MVGKIFSSFSPSGNFHVEFMYVSSYMMYYTYICIYRKICIFIHACCSLFQFLKENNLLFLFYGYECSACITMCLSDACRAR